MEIVLVAISLSMDAFAVSMCKGLCMTKVRYDRAAVIALLFGTFQAAMPLLGWFLGKQFEQYIVPIDHWITFVLLAYIGGRMIWQAIKEDNNEACDTSDQTSYKELFLLAIATSVDALAVGITFAFLQTPILPSVLLIGSITFLLSYVGVIIGHHFGVRFKTKAEIAGGVVLVLIGFKILLEHLGIIG